MEKIRLIDREDVPCWYELSFRKKNPALILRVHKDFIAGVGQIASEAPIAKYFQENFGFKKFIGSFDGNFGFNEAMKRSGEKDGFVKFMIGLPQKSKRKCEYCNGTGTDDVLERECIRCDGKKYEYGVDWQSVYAISASLNVFFTLAEFTEVVTSATHPQLITAQLITEKKLHGGSLGGRFSRRLVRWFKSFGANQTVPEVSEAMLIAYRHMVGVIGTGRLVRQEFRTMMDNGFFVADCPGNACGVNPDSNVRYHLNEDVGYEFSCHNVDSPFQQLTLLAGLAALCDRYRAEQEGRA